MKAPADFKNELNECLLKYLNDPEVLRACKRIAEMSQRMCIPYYDLWYDLHEEVELRQRARNWLKSRK